MKRKGLLLLTLLLLPGLSGCTAQVVSPLEKNEATAVPGLAMNLYAASASESNVDQVNATLYFRYLDEPMLAAESRTLTVRRDESVEKAIVQALLAGPSAGHSDLRRLIPAETKVESVTSRDDLLFVTLSNQFLKDDVPDDWADSAEGREEGPLLRRLTVQSIVASLTENFPYTGVQILVYQPEKIQTSLRLENAYFLNGTEGLSEPLTRDETLLLTPQNTAQALLTAWQQHDAERLYPLIADDGKPSYADVAETLGATSALGDFTVSGGSVSNDGQTATITASFTTQRESKTVQVPSYPLQLCRVNGIWKITYECLTKMLSR